MLKKITFIVLLLLLILSTTTVVMADKPPENGNGNGGEKDTGFDQAGYNHNAHIYNGTYGDWCLEKVGDAAWCELNYGGWLDDKLIMKWNEDWDLGNTEGWTGESYDAWLSNHGNGKLPGGSGETYFAKIVWIGECTEGEVFADGSYCIWGQFAVIMEKTQKEGILDFSTHGIPSGYGVNLQQPE